MRLLNKSKHTLDTMVLVDPSCIIDFNKQLSKEISKIRGEYHSVRRQDEIRDLGGSKKELNQKFYKLCYGRDLLMLIKSLYYLL